MENITEPTNPMLDAAERYIENINWSPEATEMEKALVAGNVRAFVQSLGKTLPAASPYSVAKNGTRRKMFPIATDILRQMITEGAEVRYRITQGLPADAKILDVCPDIFNIGSVTLLVQSESFDELKDGDQYPMGHDINAETIA